MEDKNKIRRGHPRFFALLDEMAEIHSRKNSDYAKSEDPLSNLKECEKLGVPAYMGTLIRMTDKFSRITQLSNGKKPAVNDEAIEDTLKDLAAYSLLAIILFEENKQTK